jgi:hypothetical protein
MWIPHRDDRAAVSGNEFGAAGAPLDGVDRRRRTPSGFQLRIVDYLTLQTLEDNDGGTETLSHCSRPPGGRTKLSPNMDLGIPDEIVDVIVLARTFKADNTAEALRGSRLTSQRQTREL